LINQDRPHRALSLRGAAVRVVLLDIEGTTTPITFVHDVLFPYARARVRAYLETTPASDPERIEAIGLLRDEQAHDVARNEHEAGNWKLEAGSRELEAGTWKLEAIVSYVHWLMDRDRKSRGLKLLQGKIWEQGYASGELRGDVYPDVRGALERWTNAGVGVGIFSSGSVLGQKLLFRNSTAGDLTPFLRWHFDTGVGPKVDAVSYRRIAQTLSVSSSQVLFISDVVQELDVARAAGLQTLLCVRPPAQQPAFGTHPVVRSFDEIAI